MVLIVPLRVFEGGDVEVHKRRDKGVERATAK